MKTLKEKFGFGCMRLPMMDDLVDTVQFCEMIDLFMENGFNYFDTAHGYLDGKSEKAIKECLVKRYPRESYFLTDKLTGVYFEKKEEIRPLFEKQLSLCGVEYFDYYLYHAMNAAYYEKFTRCGAFEEVNQLKQEGKIHHIGMSFHDQPLVLDRILSEHPEIEVVQLQLNYVDMENPAVKSRECYEVAVKHHKPVIVMEPIKGGMLANLTDNAKKTIDDLHGDSPASYALRYAASFENVFMVLSGMSTLEQMRDNLSVMKDFIPLDEHEYQVIDLVKQQLKNEKMIPCTACRYCTAGCPKKILIPDLFSCYNSKNYYHDWHSQSQYNELTKQNNAASDCIKCGKCEAVCPQHLAIRSLLEKLTETFEKNE